MVRSKKSDIRYRFGFAVRTRREELKLTQEELAERVGIHRTYLSNIERGTRNPSLVNIDKIAATLAMSLSELFEIVVRD
jgi:transcriptional regulator with XRE-family HTH domain